MTRDVLEMGVRVDAARDRKADQVEVRQLFPAPAVRIRPSEHDCPDLDRADSSFPVESDRQRLGRVLLRRNVRSKGAAVDVDRMAADRQHDRHAPDGERFAECRDLADAKGQIVFFEDFPQAAGHRLEIAPGEPAVGRKPFDQDELVLQPLDPRLVAQREKAPDVGEPILLRAHRAAFREREDLPDDFGDGATRLPRLPLPDEPGVLRESTRVDQQRNSVAAAELVCLADIGKRDRLPASGIVS